MGINGIQIWDLDCIGDGTHKRSDLYVLFQGFKEDFDLPTILVGGGW